MLGLRSRWLAWRSGGGQESANLTWTKIAAGGLLLATCVFAQEIPAGTVLPVMVGTSLNAKKDKPGQSIRGRLMQDVQFSSGAYVPAGAELTGQIVSVDTSHGRFGSTITLRFERLTSRGQIFSVTPNLRALASMTAVHEAQLPTSTFDDYGTSPSDWTTVQVGGDAVYRGDGTVVSPSAEVVGRATHWGAVTGRLAAVAESGCRGAPGGDRQDQALWVFSTSACGTYGFPDLRIARSGMTTPVGEITLESSGNVHVEGGSGWLLQVQGSAGGWPRH
jgi:hypothetical protein